MYELRRKIESNKAAGTEAVSILNQNNKNRKVGIIAVSVAAVLLIVLGVILFGGRSYKATVKKYISATLDADAEMLIDLMPEEVVEYGLEQDGYDSGDIDEIISDLEETLQTQRDALDSNFGKDWKFSYEIVDTEDIKDDDLEDIKDVYADVDMKISAAKNVEVEITIEAAETEKSNTMEIPLVKSGRSWYLDAMSMVN